MENLIPFKIRLATFEELERDSCGVLQSNYWFQRAICSTNYKALVRELEKKLVPTPKSVALHQLYDKWSGLLSGEWIVLGKEPQLYLAGQPGKLTHMLPIDCCIFIGPLMPSNMQGLGI